MDYKTSLNKEIKSFDCKWLSNFSAESESVFIGGRCKLELNTVRILSINANLRQYFKALYYFQLMLNGVKIPSVEAQTITKYDYRFLNALMMKKSRKIQNRMSFRKMMRNIMKMIKRRVYH